MPSRRRNQVDLSSSRATSWCTSSTASASSSRWSSAPWAGRQREYLVLEYAPSGAGTPATGCSSRPTSSTRSPVTSAGSSPPQQDGRLGLAQDKSKARRYVKQIAAELIQLYSARMATSGHAFAPDTPWQRELEDAFAYVETPDQLSSIDEVKADMERSVPMDRLICGDVGYGKTEIAVRAAFKAIQDGKQVAVLVPTLLVRHFERSPSATPGIPGRRALAVPERQGGTPGRGGPGRRQRRPRHRHAPTAVGTSATRTSGWSSSTRSSASVSSTRSSSRPCACRRRARNVRHADPAHPRDGGHRDPRDVDAGHATQERHPVLTYVGAYEEKQIHAAIRRELLLGARSSSSTTRSAASRGLRRASASWCLRPAWPRPTGRWASTSSSRSCSTSGTRSSTCWSAPRSSRRVWTSPTPTP